MTDDDLKARTKVYDDDLQAVEERIHEALTDQQYLTRDQLEEWFGGN